MNTVEEVMSHQLANKDWHRLCQYEKDLVCLLEKLGHLEINKPSNGFVGRTISLNTEG